MKTTLLIYLFLVWCYVTDMLMDRCSPKGIKIKDVPLFLMFSVIFTIPWAISLPFYRVYKLWKKVKQ